MKEKLIKIIKCIKLKKLIKNKYFKIIVIILLGLLIIREVYCVYVDIYNFKQLEKAKPYLETVDEDTERFYDLNEFNEFYGLNIKPIKNCYIVTNYNGDLPYIFGFKIESLLYKVIYKTKYYAYPYYDLPFLLGGVDIRGTNFSLGEKSKNNDVNRNIFESRISNPCRE